MFCYSYCFYVLPKRHLKGTRPGNPPLGSCVAWFASLGLVEVYAALLGLFDEAVSLICGLLSFLAKRSVSVRLVFQRFSRLGFSRLTWDVHQGFWGFIFLCGLKGCGSAHPLAF